MGLLTTLILFFVQQRRLEKVQRQQTYQRLELASNEVFRIAASNAGVLIRYQGMERDASVDLESTIVENSVAENHIYQTLNLFDPLCLKWEVLKCPLVKDWLRTA